MPTAQGGAVGVDHDTGDVAVTRESLSDLSGDGRPVAGFAHTVIMEFTRGQGVDVDDDGDISNRGANTAA